MTTEYGSSLHEPHCRNGACTGCLPARHLEFDCGHACCDERSDPFHGHFLSPSDCPRCQQQESSNAT